MDAADTFANRLRKNTRHLRKWAARRGLTAYRLYDRDMPEFPYAVDWYDGQVHLREFPRRRAVREGTAAEQRDAVTRALCEVLEVPRTSVFLSTHLPKAWGQEQYERTGQPGVTTVVTENDLRFEVELGSHLDTGLFLDHRDTRSRVRAEAHGVRFLNLFAYTGAFTVYAAAGGAAETTSVDLSGTYLSWAKRNLELNGLWGAKHHLVRADVLQWMAEAKGGQGYDLIVLDPPPHSTSKAMTRSFNVQRDQVSLLEGASALLSPRGTLYFSTNFTGFTLEEARLPELAFEELTPRSIPEDFRQKDIHRCWRVQRRAGESSS